MHLGVVDPERLDLNDDMTGFGLGLRNFPIDQAVEAAEFPVQSARIGVLQLYQEARKSRIAAAISAACVSKAK
jgi:hypothetical protein